MLRASAARGESAESGVRKRQWASFGVHRCMICGAWFIRAGPSMTWLYSMFQRRGALRNNLVVPLARSVSS